jgi:hypothetical protein
MKQRFHKPALLLRFATPNWPRVLILSGRLPCSLRSTDLAVQNPRTELPLLREPVNRGMSPQGLVSTAA